MAKFIFSILYILIAQYTYSQGSSCNQYHLTYPLKSIEWQSPNPEQLSFLNEVFTNHDILVLAESDHGYGSSYDAQCMILKGLIDSSKISSIYIESSWINCDRIVALLKQEGKKGIKESIKYMRSYELKYWVKNGFWEYLATKIIEGKVTLKGFDIDGISPLIITELYNEAKQLKSAKAYLDQAEEASKINWYFEDFAGFGPQSLIFEKSYKSIAAFTDILLQEYTSSGNNYRIKQWRSISNLFYWMYMRGKVLKGNKYANQIEGDKQSSAFDRIRDSLMAEEFLDSYKSQNGAKVACSMSAYHALRNSYSIENLSNCCKGTEVKTMCEIIDSRIPAKLYNICFVAGAGNYGVQYYNNSSWKVKRPVKGSLEQYLYKKGYPYCFVELKGAKVENCTFYLNAIFGKYLKSCWSKNFSGVFYIRNMAPLILN